MDLMFNGTAEWRSAAIQRAGSVGAAVSRNSVLWDLIEPVQGQQDWSRHDAVIAELGQNGIEPLLALYGSPKWANGSDERLYVPPEPAAFRAWLDRFAMFARQIAGRYRGRVRRWEVWNEPNEHWFWKPKPDVDQYAEVYRAIRNAIRSADPAARVALGGLAGLNASGPDDYNGKTFLLELYRRGVYPDVVAVHPYTEERTGPDEYLQWDNNFSDIGMIYALMQAHGQGHRRMWVTEWGWSTAYVSEAVQAEFVGRSLELIARKYPYVAYATYFLDYDRPPEYFHGLFTADGWMKPSGARFRDAALLRDRAK